MPHCCSRCPSCTCLQCSKTSCKVCCEIGECGCSCVSTLCKLNCLVCPCMIILLLIFSFALLPVAMYQQQVLSNANAAGTMFSNILALFAQQVTPCTSAYNVLAKIINKVLIIVYSLLSVIATALMQTFNNGAVFGWSLNEHVAAYKQTRLKKEQVRDSYVKNALAMHGATRMDQLSIDHQTAIYYGAYREMRVVQNQTPMIDPTLICGIITDIGGFIDDFLVIFDEFILSFVQKIVSAIANALVEIQNSNCSVSSVQTCLPNLIEIFIKLIFNILLDAIPYGNCLNDIPMSIPRCICSIVGTSNRVDTYLVGCIFYDIGCNVTGYSNGFNAFVGCLDLKKLVKNIFGISSSTSSATVSIAEAQIQIAQLSAQTQDISISLEQLNALLTPVSSHMQVTNRYNFDHHAALLEIRSQKEQQIADIHRDFGISQQVYYEFMNRTLNDTLENATEPAPPSNQTYYEKFIATANASDPAVQSVVEMHDFFAENAAIAPHGLTAIEIAVHLSDTILKLWSMDDLSIETAMHHLSKVPIHKGYWAVQQLAIHGRERKNANYTVTPMDAYREVVANYTLDAVDFTKFFTYSGVNSGTVMDEQSLKAHMNQSLSDWRIRNHEILQLQNSRTMESNGLSVIITISGALSMLLLGGSQIANVNCSNICGQCCAQGFGCCSSCSSCILLLVGLIAFFGVNMITNLFTGTTDYEDIVSEILKIFGSSLLDWYNKPPTNLQIINNFADLGVVLQTSLDKIVIQAVRITVRVSMFAIPILTLPEPEPDDTILAYVQSLIFYPYFSPCTTDNDCPGKGRCRLYATSSDPCGHDCTTSSPCLNPQGNCTVAPFLIQDYCPENAVPTFNFILDFQCDTLGYNDHDLTYTNSTEFQQNGFRWPFLITTAFWRFVWQILYAPILALKFLIRLLITIAGIPGLGLFTGMLQGFPIALPFGWLLPTLTILSYFFLTPMQTVLHWIDSFTHFFSFQPFIFFQEFTRWPNWVDVPPYGSSTVSQWACFVIHVPSTLIGLFIWINVLAILIVMLVNPFSFRVYRILWYSLVDLISIVLASCGVITRNALSRGQNDYV